MKFGEIVFYIFGGLVVILLIKTILELMFKPTAEEIEAEKKLKESLADEFIYDPETGAKLTLEQAQSGHWIAHDNPNRIKSREEIDQNYHGREREAQELLNYAKSNGYEVVTFSNSQVEWLEKTIILSKYDEWSYSNSFAFNNGEGYFFFPAVTLKQSRSHGHYHESQIMFWIKDSNLTGHVYMRDKTNFEAFTDSIKCDDEIKLDNYETFVYKKSSNTINLIRVLQLFDNQAELEIEVHDGNLLVKSLKFVNREDFLRIEKIIQNIN